RALGGPRAPPIDLLNHFPCYVGQVAVSNAAREILALARTATRAGRQLRYNSGVLPSAVGVESSVSRLVLGIRRDRYLAANELTAASVRERLGLAEEAMVWLDELQALGEPPEPIRLPSP